MARIKAISQGMKTGTVEAEVKKQQMIENIQNQDIKQFIRKGPRRNPYSMNSSRYNKSTRNAAVIEHASRYGQKSSRLSQIASRKLEKQSSGSKVRARCS